MKIGLRSIPLYLIAVGVLAVSAGCETPEMQGLREENAQLKTIITKYESETRDLMGRIEEERAKQGALQVDIRNRDRKIDILRQGMLELRNQAKLTDKVRHQLEILAEKLGGTLVGNRLQLPGDFFFSSGKFSLRTDAQAVVKELATILKDEKLFLMILGHTDNVPVKYSRKRGIRNNRHLSLMRALSVLEELKKNDYPPELMYPTGWGDIHPVASNDTKIGRARNRRVEILIDPAMSGLLSVSAITGVIGPAGDGQSAVSKVVAPAGE